MGVCRGEQAAQRLYAPFLDRESQSNIIVSISDVFGEGEPCSASNTNSLSNTNLFASEQRQGILAVLTRYQTVTTNQGPAGTVLTELRKTNYTVNASGRAVNVEKAQARFDYTNAPCYEMVAFGSGLWSKFRDRRGDGYNVSITATGGGSLLRFTQVRRERLNGVLVELYDPKPQGTDWHYENADFRAGLVTELRHYTNGLALGPWLLWNARGRLLLSAEFTQPYDFQKH